MSTWKSAFLTNAGNSLLNKLVSGNTLAIVRAVSGAGYVSPALLREQTAVTDPVQDLNIEVSSYAAEGKCVVVCSLTNDGLEVGYIAKQIGLYAVDPDEGEILFCIMQAENGDGTTVPSETETDSYAADWSFNLSFTQARGITVEVDRANMVTYTGLDLYIEALAATIEEIDAAMGVGSSGGGSADAAVSIVDGVLILQ